MKRVTTKNFALALLLLAFVVVGMSLSALQHVGVDPQVSTVAMGVSLPDIEYEATRVAPKNLDRTARTAELREKIAALAPLTVSAEPDVAPPSIDLTTESVTSESAVLMQCGNYRSVSPAWQTSNVSFEVIEGARVLQSISPDPLNPLLEIRQVHLQLPLQTSVDTGRSCIPYDVIAVALDGSPIRNSERGVYAIFGSETLVGYALDGFPLYGSSDTETDSCGGVVSDGQYRYYLSQEREMILNCFAGNPVNL